MKKRLSAIIAAALILTGCSQTSNSSSSESSADTSAATTSQSAVTEESMPATDSPFETKETAAPAKEEDAANEYPLSAEDFYPAMPDADEAAMSDEALKAEITEAIKHSYFMELLKSGCCFTMDEEFFGSIVPDAAPNGEGAYYEVKAVSDKESLLALFGEAFTENYLLQLDPPLEEQLFGDTSPFYTEASENIMVPFFKEADGKLLAYSTYYGVPLKPRYNELVITSATADEVCVSVAGTSLSYDNWGIGEFVLKMENGVWKTDSFGWRTADYMGKMLSKRLNSDNLSILGKICGSVARTSEDKAFINDLWYYPVEQFMTIEEMRGFLQENFTDEAAKLYEPFIDCFIEQDGLLYRVWEGGPCPNTKNFGSYNLTHSLSRSTTFENNVETTTSQIPWSDCRENTSEVIVVLANGKIACELPCTFVNE